MRTIGLLLVLSLAGCGAPPPTRAPTRPLATVSGSHAGVTAALLSLHRSGRVVTAQVRLTIARDAPTDTLGRLDLSLAGADSIADDVRGMRLLDEGNGRVYFVLEDSTGACLCSTYTGVRPGQTLSLSAKFPAPPGDVRRVSLSVPGFPSFDDVLID